MSIKTAIYKELSEHLLTSVEGCAYVNRYRSTFGDAAGNPTEIDKSIWIEIETLVVDNERSRGLRKAGTVTLGIYVAVAVTGDSHKTQFGDAHGFDDAMRDYEFEQLVINALDGYTSPCTVQRLNVTSSTEHINDTELIVFKISAAGQFCDLNSEQLC